LSQIFYDWIFSDIVEGISQLIIVFLFASRSVFNLFVSILLGSSILLREVEHIVLGSDKDRIEAVRFISVWRTKTEKDSFFFRFLSFLLQYLVFLERIR
jgi:hypothetical protein